MAFLIALKTAAALSQGVAQTIKLGAACLVAAKVTTTIVEYCSIPSQIERQIDTAGSMLKSYDLRLKLEHSKRSTKFVEKLALAELEDDDNEQELLKLIGPITKAVYSYSREARMKFNYPKLSEDNRTAVCDFIRKRMVEDKLRVAQMAKMLPSAVALSFVRDTYEVEADMRLDICERAGRVLRCTGK